MSVKTFTTEVLTSADTNTYLANAGLVYVTSATTGSTVSTVTVSSCFNSSYDNYKIIIAGGSLSGSERFVLQLGSSVASYTESLIYMTLGSAVVLGAGTTGANWTYVGGGSTNFTSAVIELQSPFLAKYTTIQAQGLLANQITYDMGQHAVATSYSSLTITCTSAATMTGVTITVYGYRKA